MPYLHATERDFLVAAEFQDRVDAAARKLLEGGVLATAVICHPDTPYATWLIGYTVVLDPRHPIGKVTVQQDGRRGA